MDHAHLSIGELVLRKIRQNRHLGVRDRGVLDVASLHGGIWRDRRPADVEVARVRQPGPVCATAVHPQLFKVGGSAVRRHGDRRGPHAGGVLCPALDFGAARNDGFAFADPAYGCILRSGVRRREDERLPERVVPRLHAHGPGGGVPLRLRGADLLKRLRRGEPVRGDNDLSAERGDDEGETTECECVFHVVSIP